MTDPLYEVTKDLNINFRSEEVQYVVLEEKSCRERWNSI